MTSLYSIYVYVTCTCGIMAIAISEKPSATLAYFKQDIYIIINRVQNRHWERCTLAHAEKEKGT